MKSLWVSTSALWMCASVMVTWPTHASAQRITSDAPVQSARVDTGTIGTPPEWVSGLPPEPPVLIRERDLSGPRIGLLSILSSS